MEYLLKAKQVISNPTTNLKFSQTKPIFVEEVRAVRIVFPSLTS